MSDFPTLTTERLRLREIFPDDALTLFRIHGDANAMQWFGCDAQSELQEAEKMIAGWRNMPSPGRRWGIVQKSDNALIGTCGLFKWNINWKSCTLGDELDRQCWRQGYMHEALSAVFQWGFITMELNRIEAQVHPDNIASLQLLNKHGFVREGLLRQAGYWNGQHQDMVQHALLREEYAPPSA